MDLKIRTCKEADKEHAKNLRQYAHTYHYKRTMCVANAFWGLPIEHKLGLLYHEMGHLLAGLEGSEEDADRFAETEFGIKIRYKDGKFGERLQYVDVDV